MARGVFGPFSVTISGLGRLRPVERSVKSVQPQALSAVPLFDRFLRVFVVAPILWTNHRLDPARLVAQHQMRAHRWQGQRRIDRRDNRINKFPPTPLKPPQAPTPPTATH